MHRRNPSIGRRSSRGRRCGRTATTAMTATALLGILLLLSTVSVVAALKGDVSSNNIVRREKSAMEYIEDQIQWVRSNGGFVHDGLRFRPIGAAVSSQKGHQDGVNEAADSTAADNSNPSGIFTTVDFRKGDTVMVIPRKVLLTSSKSGRGVRGGECGAVASLVKARKLGEKSKYAPYVSYLFEANAMPALPSLWSDEGKKVINSVLGKHLPTSGTMTEASFTEHCGKKYTEEPDRALTEQAYYFVLMRSWDDVLIPVFDLINHRSGHWKNVDSSKVVGTDRDITVSAVRDIKAGEQLYLSYNNCTDSNSEFLTWVTPHLLRDFGFLEQYPRRWAFRPEGKWGKALVFELDEKQAAAEVEAAATSESSGCEENEDVQNNEIVLTWLTSRKSRRRGFWGLPETWNRDEKESILNFFVGELRRLRDVTPSVSGAVKKLQSSHERETIVEFHNALATAIQLAIKSIAEGDEKNNHDLLKDVIIGQSGRLRGEKKKPCLTTDRSSSVHDKKGGGGGDDDRYVAATFPSMLTQEKLKAFHQLEYAGVSFICVLPFAWFLVLSFRSTRRRKVADLFLRRQVLKEY